VVLALLVVLAGAALSMSVAIKVCWLLVLIMKTEERPLYQSLYQ
jgi:hypothetical protein